MKIKYNDEKWKRKMINYEYFVERILVKIELQVDNKLKKEKEKEKKI